MDFIHSPPQRVHLFHDGSFVGPFVYGRTMTARHGHAEAGYTPTTRTKCSRSASSAAAIAYQFWGLSTADYPSGLPGRGRPAVPARHRPARPRRAVAHHLRRAHLADHRPDRHHLQLHPRHRHRRPRRLPWRLVRPGRPAHHRGPAIDPEHPAVDGAGRDHAGDLEPDRSSISASPSSSACSTGPAWRARCAPSCWRCARRTTCWPPS